MEKAPNQIQVHYRNPSLIKDLVEGLERKNYELRYNQGEEFFVVLEEDYTIPPIPIHHDVGIVTPDKNYLEILNKVLNQVVPLAPQIFRGLTYFFDPSEILRPTFFQIFKVQEKNYLYLLRMDLMYRTGQGSIKTTGTNDMTAEFATNQLFLEADFIPLKEIDLSADPPNLIIEQTISQTWIGQRGKGYHVQGIWIDIELTKFFTKLFLPKGKRSYPYYPFSCKYKTICHTPLDLSLEGRKKHLPSLIRTYNFIMPRLEKILDALKQEDFQESSEIFQLVKKEVPPSWTEIWKNLTVTPFLNEFDRKEFRIDFE